MMEWLKATGIAVVILVVGLGAFIGVNQFLSGSAEDEATKMAAKKAKVSAAKTLITKSQNSKADPGLLTAFQVLRAAKEPFGTLKLGCIDARGKRYADRCISLTKIDLSPSKELELKPVIFTGINLSGANIPEANLSWVSFKQANLQGANLSTSWLYRTNFEGANLFKANLSGADLLYTDFLNANISGVNMAGVKNLRQERLNRACLGNAKQAPIGLPNGLKPPTKKC
jgi:hypothetical protein